MSKMQFDIKVKNGTYVNSQNETKSRYKTVGKVMINDDGSQFALLDPTINLAGFERDAGKDMLIGSFFEPYEQNQQQNNNQQSQGGFQGQPQGQQGGFQHNQNTGFQQR